MTRQSKALFDKWKFFKYFPSKEISKAKFDEWTPKMVKIGGNFLKFIVFPMIIGANGNYLLFERDLRAKYERLLYSNNREKTSSGLIFYQEPNTTSDTGVNDKAKVLDKSSEENDSKRQLQSAGGTTRLALLNCDAEFASFYQEHQKHMKWNLLYVPAYLISGGSLKPQSIIPNGSVIQQLTFACVNCTPGLNYSGGQLYERGECFDPVSRDSERLELLWNWILEDKIKEKKKEKKNKKKDKKGKKKDKKKHKKEKDSDDDDEENGKKKKKKDKKKDKDGKKKDKKKKKKDKDDDEDGDEDDEARKREKNKDKKKSKDDEKDEEMKKGKMAKNKKSKKEKERDNDEDKVKEESDSSDITITEES